MSGLKKNSIDANVASGETKQDGRRVRKEEKGWRVVISPPIGYWLVRASRLNSRTRAEMNNYLIF